MGEIDSNPLLESAMEQRLIRRIAGESADAICGLWDEPRGCYWRDTEQRKTKSSDVSEFFPTVTYRSTEALLDLNFRYPDWISEDERVDIIHNRLPRIFKHSLPETPSALDAPDSAVRNPFTTALYLVAARRANELVKPAGGKIVRSDDIEVATRQLLAACIGDEGRYSTGHPFIQFHILRGIMASITSLRDNRLKNDITSLRDQIVRSLKNETEQLLARHKLDQLAPSDSVALVFCAAALAFWGDPDDRYYVLPALNVGFEAQDVSGCWPLGRVVRRNRGKRGERAWDFLISTYEIAWAASETLLRLLKQRESLPRSQALPGLERLLSAGRYAERSLVELQSKDAPKRGWCSDPPYGELLVESWTSANVLQSIVSLNELIDEEKRNETLQTFVFRDPRAEDWPSWRRWDKLMEGAEPEDASSIFNFLNKRIVEPIRNDPRNLPSSKDERVSLLFFGPPGTSKTTIVHGLAHGLGWPIVMLSPGDFIEKGLEYIEAQARVVFDRLKKLHRVVVLFDECDELFRDRQPSNESEPMRNITAFVTASMLPKLQDLHDRGQLVFCVCTNKFETLDPAMRRTGRIDHIIPVGPPEKAYRRRIVTQQLQSIPSSDLKEAAIEQLVDNTEGFVRREIQRTCQVVLSMELDWADGAKVVHAVSEAANQAKHSLTIPPEDFERFQALALKYPIVV